MTDTKNNKPGFFERFAEASFKGLLILGALLAPIAMFGCIRDWPRFVKDNEGWFEKSAQWISALFHVFTPALLLYHMGADTPWWTLVFFTWCMWGSLVLARRAGAAYATAGAVYIRYDWWRGLGSARWLMVGMLIVLGASYSIQSMAHVVILPITRIAWLLALTTVAVLYFKALRTGRRVHRRAIKEAALIKQFRAVISSLFGVSEELLKDTEHAVFRMDQFGNLVMTKVPNAIKLKMADGWKDALDAKMALLNPDYQLDPLSSPQEILIMPVTDERRARRAELARTGGVFVTAESAESGHDYEPTQDYDAERQAPSQLLDLTNEEW